MANLDVKDRCDLHCERQSRRAIAMQFHGDAIAGFQHDSNAVGRKPAFEHGRFDAVSAPSLTIAILPSSLHFELLPTMDSATGKPHCFKVVFNLVGELARQSLWIGAGVRRAGVERVIFGIPKMTRSFLGFKSTLSVSMVVQH